MLGLQWLQLWQKINEVKLSSRDGTGTFAVKAGWRSPALRRKRAGGWLEQKKKVRIDTVVCCCCLKATVEVEQFFTAYVQNLKQVIRYVMSCQKMSYWWFDVFPAVIRILNCILRHIDASSEQAVFFLWFHFCRVNIFTIFYKENQI